MNTMAYLQNETENIYLASPGGMGEDSEKDEEQDEGSDEEESSPENP